MGSWNHRATNARKSGAVAAFEQAEKEREYSHKAWIAVQRGADIDNLRQMLSDERFSEMRHWLTGTIQWLYEAECRYLTPRQRECIDRIWRVARMKERGVPIDPSKRRHSSPKRWPKAPIAAFLNDPSLLPKAPPGRLKASGE